MGFDLYGQAPKSKRGEYFRNNVWWWRHLWTLVTLACHSFMFTNDTQGGCTNSGYLIGKRKASKIATKLEGILKSNKRGLMLENIGLVNKPEVNLKKYGTKEPVWEMDEHLFSWGNVREFIKFCKESGGFKIC